MTGRTGGVKPELHWCVVCLNTPARIRRYNTRQPAATMRPTSDGTICVCDTHAGLIDNQQTTVENILRAKRGEDASRRAT